MNTHTTHGDLVIQMPIALNTIEIWQMPNAQFRLIEVTSRSNLSYWIADYRFITDAIARANQLIAEEMNTAQIYHELIKVPFGTRY